MPKDKRVKKVVHPNSRLASQLAKKAHSEQKSEQRMKKVNKFDVLGDKLRWFQENLEEEKKSYTKAEACQLVEKYLNRFEEELEQIGIKQSMKGRDGQQHASRENTIQMTLQRDRQEYETGFEIPDIINGKHMKVFREWNGELRYLPNLKLKTVKITDAKPQAEKEEEELEVMQEEEEEEDGEIVDSVEEEDS